MADGDIAQRRPRKGKYNKPASCHSRPMKEVKSIGRYADRHYDPKTGRKINKG